MQIIKTIPFNNNTEKEQIIKDNNIKEYNIIKAYPSGDAIQFKENI